MDIITVIEYMIVASIFAYGASLVLVWIYEIRKNAAYKTMQEHVRTLECRKLSMAVLHAKMYKITEDYRQETSALDKGQQFILEHLLFIRKSSLKNTPSAAVR